MLKGKWRKLKYLDVTNLEFIPSVIVAACLLHNFIIESEGEQEDFEISDMDSSDDVDDEENVSTEEDEDQNEPNQAMLKRNRICNRL